MDFGKIDLEKASNKGASCHLNDPVYGTPLFTEEGAKITVSVLGRDSGVFRKAMAVASEREAVSGFSDQGLANTVEVMAAMVTGWQNIIWGGKPLEFTPENVTMFLTKFPPVLKQLDVFVGKRSNFFKDAATS